MNLEENQDRYLQVMHAIQSGVAYEQEHGSPDGTPKHLRVGIAGVQISHAALVGLLINKGVITLEEYVEANRVEAEAVLKEYEDRINGGLGGPGKVHLR